MLAMAGVEQRPEQHVDGKNFTTLLQGEQEFARGPIYWHYPHYGNQGGRPAAAIRDGDWKLIEFFEDGRTELYNLASDLSEQHDVASSESDRTTAMLEQLHKWQKSVGAKFPTPNPKYASQ
jgi:arylsulfatase A-like enzyme